MGGSVRRAGARKRSIRWSDARRGAREIARAHAVVRAKRLVAVVHSWEYSQPHTPARSNVGTDGFVNDPFDHVIAEAAYASIGRATAAEGHHPAAKTVVPSGNVMRTRHRKGAIEGRREWGPARRRTAHSMVATARSVRMVSASIRARLGPGIRLNQEIDAWVRE